MGSSEGGAFGRVEGVYLTGSEASGWSWVFLLDDVLLFGATACPRLCSGGRATATRHQQGGVGDDDTVWCHEAGVCGAGDEG